MPMIREGDFLEANSWLVGDLKYARDNIDTIVNDLVENGTTHVNYVLEKLEASKSILTNICNVCKKQEDKDE